MMFGALYHPDLDGVSGMVEMLDFLWTLDSRMTMID